MFKYNNKLYLFATVAILGCAVQVTLAIDEPMPAPAKTAIPAELANFCGSALVVNDDAVTSYEIINQTKDQLAAIEPSMNFEQYISAARPILNKSLMEYLYKLLIYQHAKSLLEKNENFEPVIKGAIEREKKIMLAKYDGSIARTEQELAKQGKTLDGELEQLRRELTVTSFKETYFTPTLTITRTQMLQSYNKYKDEKFVKTPSIQYQLIEIPFSIFADQAASPERAKQLALESAQQAAQQLAGGADFAETVAKFSHGLYKQQNGLWPVINPDSLKEQYKPLIAALEKIQPNQVTDVVEGADRFFIAKLIERKDARTVTFTQAQPEIEEEIKKERWIKFSQNLAEKLLKTSSVGSIDRFIVQTAVIAYKKRNAGT